MILEGLENKARVRLPSLTGFVLSASLLALFRLLSKRASVALKARSLVVVPGVLAGVGVPVEVGVGRGNSNWPPGIVPLRGLG